MSINNEIDQTKPAYSWQKTILNTKYTNIVVGNDPHACVYDVIAPSDAQVVGWSIMQANNEKNDTLMISKINGIPRQKLFEDSSNLAYLYNESRCLRLEWDIEQLEHYNVEKEWFINVWERGEEIKYVFTQPPSFKTNENCEKPPTIKLQYNNIPLPKVVLYAK